MAAAFISRNLDRSLRQRVCRTIPPPQSFLLSTSAPAISNVPQSEQEERGRSSWSKLLLFMPGAITFGLGTWQIIRRQEKDCYTKDTKYIRRIKMLEYRKGRLDMEPLKGNEAVSFSGNLDSLDFRKVQCKGFFDEKKSIYIGPRSRSISGVTENGYYIITPLIPVPADPESVQSPILVNRGWVPRSWRDKALGASHDTPPSSSSTSTQASGKKVPWWPFWYNKQEVFEEPRPSLPPTEVIGVVRSSENPSIFVPANDPNAGQWFYVDIPALARACELPENTHYIEDINENINPSSPYPMPKDVNTLICSSVMPQDHVNYTLTWYTLSAAVTFMAYKRLKPRKMRR
ncbi:hypothetical protein OROHE_015503 [Orobanche hederae]